MQDEFSVPEAAPCVQGHFPGAPVVPGAWLLARADAVLRQAYPGWRVSSFTKVKFLAPLRPDECARIERDDRDWPRVTLRIIGPSGPVLGALASLVR
ncbi:hypothetical protein [Marinimicrobium sp. ARAG 43.8]|uniref:hypothetical protein n=1 Tax=Marinimicrobium sp. ARAG 43.8 TaxID=3418719 RepID=UPI003CEF93FE